MDDTAVTAPFHPALSEITQALADKPFPVFLTKFGPALWPVTDETAGPPVIVLSVPRSGTYFTEALYKRMGYGGVYVHAMDRFCNDVRLRAYGIRNLKISGMVAVPISIVSQLVLPGQIIVSHCDRNAEIEAALSRFKKIYLYRDLREVIVSHARADSKLSVARGKGPVSVIEFCQNRGKQLKAVIERVARWRDSDEVLALDFAHLTSADAARQQMVASRFAAFMGWSETAVIAALERVPSDSTLTRSEGGHSKLEGAWDEECEAWFSEHMADVIVHPTGSPFLASAAERPVPLEARAYARYAGDKARWRAGCELTEATQMNNGSTGKSAVTAADLVMLPASRYAKYALPLDYPPSRDFRPRWGNTRPAIGILYDWFAEHAPDYDSFLDEMRQSAQFLESVPREFHQENLPEPAWFGVPFTPFDSLALYTMVRRHKPRTYVEVGSGISTRFVAKAVRDHHLNTRIISIDPQPRAAIDGICDEIVREGLETCDLAVFETLQAGDIVFLDGSHRSFMNSDVTVFMIDVLPRLRPGVVVHVHDVMLPWDYADMFVDWYWNEQYILAAYMIAGRDKLAPLFPTNFVCREQRFLPRTERPFIDFGEAALNEGWRYGGSMWFTHRAAAAPRGSTRGGREADEAPSAGGPPTAAAAPAAAGAPPSAAARLSARIGELRALDGDGLARLDLERLGSEIREILDDPVFDSWPLDRQLPLVERIYAIYTWCEHAGGRLLIPALERLFGRAVASPDITLDALCTFYDLLYFLYWNSADNLKAMAGVADRVMAPFGAAIRGGAVRGLPAICPRPLGKAPLRLGYLSQFAHGLHDSVGMFAHFLLGGLLRHLPGRYRLFLYAWSEHDDASLTALAGSDIAVRRFAASAMAERIAAVAAAIAEDEIDILITDMNSALPAVLFERRAAPVQVYNVMGGLPFWPLANIDGYFRIDVYDPRLDGFDPDKCFPLGLGPWDLTALAPAIDAERIAAERARFPRGARLIGTYGRLAKMTSEFLEIVGEILARLPQVTVILGGTGDGGQIREFIAAHGLTGRLELIEGYVEGHVWAHILEVFLDTFPLEGGVSRREVMARGVPIVTMNGPWAQFEAVPALVASDRAAYLDVVARLIEDRQFYEEACVATREFVAAGMSEADYVAALDAALQRIVGQVRPGLPVMNPDAAAGKTLGCRGRRGLARALSVERLSYGSVIDLLRDETPARVVPVVAGWEGDRVETACAEDVLYLPDLHLQIWRDRLVPSETDTTVSDLQYLQQLVRTGKITVPCTVASCEIYDDEVFVLSNRMSHNFYHFLESLYQVLILEHSGFAGKYVFAGCPGIGIGPAPRFQQELLGLLGIVNDRVMHVCEPTLFRSTRFATSIAHTDALRYSGAFFALRQRLLNAEPPEGSCGSRLWLARRYRGIVNHEEVYKCLHNHGFTIVEMSELPVAQQIAAARAADMLGGAHGAAMIHSMFLKDASTVIECFSPKYVNPCVIEICRNLRHRYFQLVQRNTPIFKYGHGEDVEVNLYMLNSLLERL